MAVTPPRSETTTGVAEHAWSPLHVSGPVVVPLPSSPYWLSPQHWTEPLERRAQAVWFSPTEMAVTPLRPETATGVDELVVMPLPRTP